MQPSSELRQPVHRERLQRVFANQTEILGVIGLRCRIVLHFRDAPCPARSDTGLVE